ncbi:L-carnitine dehydratase/bile acid-inducible protein F [Capsaspora owczarzaki ATCC 30864]|uniref:L-carnitine dehydratase/bile acid-inducible protein F n=1 Tax=Capsaspora owczarzaki (strain ATCC 30864) TaxID=595528 RepID=A0A0D2U047_CAPO3|nr:L-carnitine dehydratase/bile acid-inducible protein F [Capsaspora owczarzaki ATCC 30864]KJE88551.1 L-carnitine dehydratase/bile acid-inducible protein F [Capsaspora owczarzaki ATCC 30864]|eukprot:XP_004365063.1 L-carnitine dehydratase/bile acid-inducible protein F [Capsaspora owczarzaki ATCC 30864]
MAANIALRGVRVLDLSRVLAAPFCTMLLGDMGADVIKIESPNGGDDTRKWGPPFAAPAVKRDNHQVPVRQPESAQHTSAVGQADASAPAAESAYFLAANRNKRSVTVNLKSERGVQIVRELAATADVLVENFLPGKMEQLGLGYEGVLQPLNPRLVYCSLTGFGRHGPYRDRAGYDLVTQAMGGLMHITGQPGSGPVKVGVAITDLATGLFAHGAILTALLARTHTNRGQRVDCSLMSSTVALLANIGSNYLIAGKEAKRLGNAHPSIVPYQSFQSSDGEFVVAVGNDAQFVAFCRVLGLPDLPRDSRFAKNADRVAHREVLIPLIAAMLRTQPTAHWMDALTREDLPCGPINNLQQVFNDPHVLATGLIQQVEHPTVGRISLTGSPVQYSDTPARIALPPPTLGQHTDQILAEVLGYTPEQIAALRRDKVI